MYCDYLASIFKRTVCNSQYLIESSYSKVYCHVGVQEIVCLLNCYWHVWPNSARLSKNLMAKTLEDRVSERACCIYNETPNIRLT